MSVEEVTEFDEYLMGGIEMGFEDHGVCVQLEMSTDSQNLAKLKENVGNNLASMLRKINLRKERHRNRPKRTKVRNTNSGNQQISGTVSLIRPQISGYTIQHTNQGPAGAGNRPQQIVQNTPISVLRPYSVQQKPQPYVSQANVRPGNTVSFIRPNTTVNQGQTLMFDPASGLIIYPGQLTQQQANRNVNNQGTQKVYANTNPNNLKQYSNVYTLVTTGVGATSTNNTTTFIHNKPYQTAYSVPKIVGTTSIRPGVRPSTMPPPSMPQTNMVNRVAMPTVVQRLGLSQHPQAQMSQQAAWRRPVAPQNRQPVPQTRQPVPPARPPVPQARPLAQARPQVPQTRPPVPQVRPPVSLTRPPAPQTRPTRAQYPMASRSAQLSTPRMVTPSSQIRPVPIQPKITNQAGKISIPPSRALPASAISKLPIAEQSKAAETSSPTVETPGSENDSNNNKTFPSLVVNVKPCLMEKQNRNTLGVARSELDAKVKSLLVYSPQKFTEWLMQRGLLRIEHRCTIHVGDDNQPYPFNLGMYSDNRHPFSGGYVWISDCCGREKEASVFQGSIFESSIYTPGTLLKLIYHWSCQTTATNVLQWVKQVTSYYLKNFYTLLRSACVAALHEMCPVMGGSDKYVEIGIITLGTTLSSQGGPKSVKVEILGVFDPSAKIIRMKVINPQNDMLSQASHSRIMQILWPLNHWVNKSSTILIDNSIDKTLLEEMGFKNVQQSKGPISNPGQKQVTPTNINVMNYLKHVIPKMFQSTLCVLSKSLIQQFLDELSWREIWGGNPSKTFENMLNHLVEMTKWDTGETLISRLNKISLDPFGEWSYSRNLPQGIDMLPSSITCSEGDMPLLSIQAPLAPKVQNGSVKPVPASTSSKNKTNPTPKPPTLIPQVSPSSGGSSSGLKRKFTMDLTPFLAVEPKNYTLQKYYYATAASKRESVFAPYGGHLKCPLCMKPFLTSKEIMPHMFRHVMQPGSRATPQNACDYCLKDFSSKMSLGTHVKEVHTMGTSPYSCRICQEKFVSEGIWIIHMWENHDEVETPYICELCDFRSSFHTETIDHFNKVHEGSEHVICPLCLKTLTVRTLNCVKQVVIHFQNHNLRRNKKCPQCILLFHSDNEYRSHITVDKAHRSQQGVEFQRYKMTESDVHCYMPKPPKVPKDKFVLPPPAKKAKIAHHPPKGASLNTFATPIDPDGKYTVDPFEIEVFCEDNTMCIECKKDIESDGHFGGYLTCNKCSFATCCMLAMTNHHKRCHSETKPSVQMSGLKLKAVKLLPVPLRCRCDFSSANPYHLAEHLIQCDQPTAFPAVQSSDSESTAQVLSDTDEPVAIESEEEDLVTQPEGITESPPANDSQ